MSERNDIWEIIANANCEHCGRHYKQEDVNLVQQRAGSWRYIMYCPFCDNIVSGELPPKKELRNNVRL